MADNIADFCDDGGSQILKAKRDAGASNHASMSRLQVFEEMLEGFYERAGREEECIGHVKHLMALGICLLTCRQELESGKLGGWGDLGTLPTKLLYLPPGGLQHAPQSPRLDCADVDVALV